MMKMMGASNRTVALNQVTIPVMIPHLSWHRFPMMRYVFSISLIILSAYEILLHLANALPRKTVVDLSHGSCKQLRKTGAHKCKTTKAQSGPLTSTSKCARTTTNVTPDEGESVPGGVSRNSSLMSIESLIWKVSNIVHHSFDSFDLHVQLAGKQNPIYHFYETVSTNLHGEVGNSSDRHYKCYHGNHKVITVIHAMKYSVNGKQPLCFRTDIYSQTSDIHCRLSWTPQDALSSHVHTEPPTTDDLMIACMKKVLDMEAANAYLGGVEVTSTN